MNIIFPPPHMLFHEPMDDREMIRVWNEYKTAHASELETFEIDAATVCSVDEFGKLFEGESRVFRNKALINSETFVDTVRKLRAFYDKNKNECFEHFGLELPPVVNFMTFLETAVSSLGVEQLLAHA